MIESSSANRRRVLILGGDFGGACAAQRLGQTLDKRQHIEVVLISRENYLLFTPMLHELAADDLYPPDQSLRQTRFVEGEVIDVDLAARVVPSPLDPCADESCSASPYPDPRHEKLRHVFIQKAS